MMSRVPAATSEMDDLRQLKIQHHELAVRHDLTPFTQGKLDCLCGIYSIINAVRLLRQPVWPVSHMAARQLFETGTASLLRKGLLDAAVVDGMVIRHWKQLAALLTRQASTDAFNVTVETPTKSGRKLPAESTERWMVESIANGKPVLMHLGRRHQHYTVVAGIDRHQISLFDSWGLIRIKRAGFVLRQDITATCLMRFSLQNRM